MSEEAVREHERNRYRLTYRKQPTEGCPLGETDSTVSEFSVFQGGTERQCELLVRAEDGTIAVESYTRPADMQCPCSVVVDHGMLPHFRPAESGERILLTIYVSGSKEAQSITEALESVAGKAELVDYETLDETTRDWTVHVDLGLLTEKRREALEHALSDGYYETPSQTTIAEMAARTGISSSAFATRLRKAEREVYEQIGRSL